MRKLILMAVGLVCAISMATTYANQKAERRSDTYIRNRVLMLTGKGIECSAIEVLAPSGKVYTMSAAHCEDMLQYGLVDATAEDGSMKILKMIDIDKEHDLMLLEGFDKNSVRIAKNDYKYEKIHTLTHGRGMPTYRTDGELLKENLIVYTEPIWSQDDMTKCEKDGRQIVMSMDGLGCQFKVILAMSTAQVVPGSSGGGVFNTDGELVGIVSGTDGFFSGFVPLHDIQAFLKHR